MKAGKPGIALAGLGNYSTKHLAPALQETQHCYLAGIVSGTAAKAGQWQEQYAIPEKNIYTYDNFDSIKDNPAIDIVYIVTPNALHASLAIRAAEAGKHVICEKPMAVTVQECDRVIKAFARAEKKISIGYRLHFEPHNKEMMSLGRNKIYGAVKKIIARHGRTGTEGWRLDKKLAGGGALPDVGIYCLQAAMYVTGMEPVAVQALEGKKTNPGRFYEVEESLVFQLEFPGGITADCQCSYSEEMNLLHVEAANGWFELSPAFAYSGIEGKTPDGPMPVRNVNQQALQMDDFALAIKNNKPTPVPGEMGKRDVGIIQAVYEAMKTGKRITLT